MNGRGFRGASVTCLDISATQIPAKAEIERLQLLVAKYEDEVIPQLHQKDAELTARAQQAEFRPHLPEMNGVEDKLCRRLCNTAHHPAECTTPEY